MSRSRAELEERLATEKLGAQHVRDLRGNSYVEGHYVTRKLNEVFGAFGWHTSIKEMRLVHEGPDPDPNKAEKGQVRVGYLCEMSLFVQSSGEEAAWESTSRQDVGSGEGIGKSVAAAHESAAKEAVTDALKRCAMRLGDVFGLALYDGEGTDSPNVRPPTLDEVRAALEAGEYEEAKDLGRLMPAGEDRTEAVRLVREATKKEGN